MDGKEKIVWSIFSLVIGIAIILYVMGLFTNMDTIRRIHFDYMAGFSFQKECKDEYTEQESSRKHAYDALIKNRPNMTFGNLMNKYTLFWVPVGICILMTIYLKDVQIIYPDGTKIPYAGYFYLGIILTVVLIVLLQKVLLDEGSKVQMFVHLNDKDCYTNDPINSIKSQHRVQMVVCLILMVVLAGFYYLQKMFEKWIANTQATVQPGGLGRLFFESTLGKNYYIYTIVVLWIFSMIWIFKMTDFYEKLQMYILCYYPEQITTYKMLLQQYINDDKKYQAVKGIIEQTYLRIHKTYPDINQSNIDDYIYYLMHAKGRELENLTETPELINFKNFMMNLRSNTTYDFVLRDFLKWCTNYFILQFILVLYIVFHILYMQFKGPVSYSIIIGTIIIAFVLSWYSWFDTVLVV